MERIRSYLLRDRDALRGCRIGGMTQDAAIAQDPVLREPVVEALAWLVDQLTNEVRAAQDAGDLDDSLNPLDPASWVAVHFSLLTAKPE